MATMFARQPNGLFACYDTIFDTFTHFNLDHNGMFDIMGDNPQAQDRVSQAVSDLEFGAYHYQEKFQPCYRRWLACLDQIMILHGKGEAERCCKEGSRRVIVAPDPAPAAKPEPPPPATPPRRRKRTVGYVIKNGENRYMLMLCNLPCLSTIDGELTSSVRHVVAWCVEPWAAVRFSRRAAQAWCKSARQSDPTARMVRIVAKGRE